MPCGEFMKQKNALWSEGVDMLYLKGNLVLLAILATIAVFFGAQIIAPAIPPKVSAMLDVNKTTVLSFYILLVLFIGLRNLVVLSDYQWYRRRKGGKWERWSLTISCGPIWFHEAEKTPGKRPGCGFCIEKTEDWK
jgi:hypothetical protein